MTPRALALGLLAVAVLLVGAAWGPLIWAGSGLLLLWGLACAGDWWRAPSGWSVERRSPPALGLGTENRIELRIVCAGAGGQRVFCRDEVPDLLICRPEVLSVSMSAAGDGLATYVVIPRRRGTCHFTRVVVRARGPAKLWNRQTAIDCAAEVPVYPALAAIGAWESVSRRGGVAELGVRSWRRYGEGTDFAGVREHVVGDDLRRVNWRATARLARPMTSQYEPERARPLWLLLDQGRLMAGGDRITGKFDIALSSALLLAWVALTRGDRVGAATVADGLNVLAAARPGRSQYQRILSGLAPLVPRLVDPDWELAITSLRRHQGPRALVVVFTDLADPALSEQLARSMATLRPRHVPLVVTQRDPALDAAQELVPESLQGVYTRAAALGLLEERRAALDRLVTMGVLTVDSGSDGVAPAVLNRYLELKGRGAF